MKIVASLFLLLSFALTLRAQTPGALDLSFASVGYRVDATSDTVDYGVVRVMADGRIVAAALSTIGPDIQVRIFRYLTDGSLDTSFAHTGTMRTTGPIVNSDYLQMNLQADGKILLYYQAPATLDGVNVVGRVDLDGSMDPTFGQNGWVMDSSDYPIGSPGGIAVQTDGKILLAGSYQDDNTSYYGLYAQRLLSNGVTDSSYGVAGTAGVLSTAYGMSGRAAVVQPDGKWLVFGETYDTVNFGNDNIVLGRFNTDGSPDLGFGNNGIVWDTQVPISQFAYDIAVGAQGEIYILGENPNSTITANCNLAQFSSNGTLNTSFGTGGWMVVTDPTNDLYPEALEVLPDGTLLVAFLGSDINGNTEVPNLIHYLPNFTRDLSLGLNGIARPVVGPDGLSIASLALQPDGKIVIEGSSEVNWRESRQTIARYGAMIATATLPAFAATAEAAMYPNPSTGQAQLRFTLQEAATVSIVVTDLLGRTVAQPVSANAYAQGVHACGLDLSGVPAGSYLVRLVAGDDVQTLRVVVAR